MDLLIQPQNRLNLSFFLGYAFTFQLTKTSKDEFMYLSIKYQSQIVQSPTIQIKPKVFLRTLNTTKTIKLLEKCFILYQCFGTNKSPLSKFRSQYQLSYVFSVCFQASHNLQASITVQNKDNTDFLLAVFQCW